jgi:hypothetical protein
MYSYMYLRICKHVCILYNMAQKISFCRELEDRLLYGKSQVLRMCGYRHRFTAPIFLVFRNCKTASSVQKIIGNEAWGTLLRQTIKKETGT